MMLYIFVQVLQHVGLRPSFDSWHGDSTGIKATPRASLLQQWRDLDSNEFQSNCTVNQWLVILLFCFMCWRHLCTFCTYVLLKLGCALKIPIGSIYHQNQPNVNIPYMGHGIYTNRKHLKVHKFHLEVARLLLDQHGRPGVQTIWIPSAGLQLQSIAEAPTKSWQLNDWFWVLPRNCVDYSIIVAYRWSYILL